MIYLDNTATTIKKPQCVKQAVFDAMDRLGNSARGMQPGKKQPLFSEQGGLKGPYLPATPQRH